MAAVHPPASRLRSALRPKIRVAAAFLAGLLLGGTGLAAADALPDPAQHAAHRVLGSVGVDVPDPERYHGPECGAEVKGNHGGYVRDDHTLAQTACGQKVSPGQGAGKGQGSASADKGPCRGKPEWAGNPSMTPEERAAAQAEREAACPGDADADDPPDAAEGQEPEQSPAEATTTTVVTAEPTTTTTEPTTSTLETAEPTTTSLG